jgi:hypothetical protein
MTDHYAAHKRPGRYECDSDNQLQDIEVAHDASTCLYGTRTIRVRVLSCGSRASLPGYAIGGR